MAETQVEEYVTTVTDAFTERSPYVLLLPSLTDCAGALLGQDGAPVYLACALNGLIVQLTVARLLRQINGSNKWLQH